MGAAAATTKPCDTRSSDGRRGRCHFPGGSQAHRTAPYLESWRGGMGEGNNPHFPKPQQGICLLQGDNVKSQKAELTGRVSPKSEPSAGSLTSLAVALHL